MLVLCRSVNDASPRGDTTRKDISVGFFSMFLILLRV